MFYTLQFKACMKQTIFRLYSRFVILHVGKIPNIGPNIEVIQTCGPTPICFTYFPVIRSNDTLIESTNKMSRILLNLSNNNNKNTLQECISIKSFLTMIPQTCTAKGRTKLQGKLLRSLRTPLPNVYN